ncbi:efflux RND transporter periplasmic adaptor subunit [Pseudoalteromonas fenneropenaei]|uniref:Efflux RND transporter periplasmic adaptor subunit n=1 Tax=Pseudoalteromonas fenneropenaei TaxID=1737459 RepID=A0ABV7CHV6_9GAMM
MLNKIHPLVFIAFAVTTPTAFAAQPVKVEAIQAASLQKELEIHGTLHGKGDVELAAGTGGHLQMIKAPGESAKKGELIAQVDVLPLEIERAQHQESLNRAKINLRYYEQESARLQALAKSNSAAASQVDLVNNQRDLAKSDIAMAELKIRQVDDTIARASLRAPFNGVISERFKMPNSEVNRADRLLRFVDIHNLEVRVYVPMKYLGYVSVGDKLNVKGADNQLLKRAEAVVDAVIPASDTRSQTFEVRAKLINSEQVWASGQLVDVTMPLSQQQPALLVNRDALILRQQGVHIVKINADNTATKIAVSVGKGQGQLVEVTPTQQDALLPGDKIAVRGAERLSDGQAVEVQ